MNPWEADLGLAAASEHSRTLNSERTPAVAAIGYEGHVAQARSHQRASGLQLLGLVKVSS